MGPVQNSVQKPAHFLIEPTHDSKQLSIFEDGLNNRQFVSPDQNHRLDGIARCYGWIVGPILEFFGYAVKVTFQDKEKHDRECYLNKKSLVKLLHNFDHRMKGGLEEYCSYEDRGQHLERIKEVCNNFFKNKDPEFNPKFDALYSHVIPTREVGAAIHSGEISSYAEDASDHSPLIPSSLPHPNSGDGER